MGNKKTTDIRIVRGSDRFASSSNTNLFVQVPFQSSQLNKIEGDRTVIVDLEQRFNKERQESSIIRISGKITNIFENTISGTTTYPPYLNSLYYLEPEVSIVNNVWKGYPPFAEFDFFRTSGITGHPKFVSKSASTYNWDIYLTKPYDNFTGQTMQFKDPFSGNTLTFNVSDGIPFVIKNRVVSGKKLITFYCGGNHNLSVGDYVYLNFTINGRDKFEVYSLGDSSYGNEKTVFSIFNFGFSQGVSLEGALGTFRRIVDINNSGETLSEYYVKRHRVLLTPTDLDLTRAGFENNAFPKRRKLEYSAITPDHKTRISTLNGNQSYTFSFDKDVDISLLRDNLDRPISELFVTIVHKGFYGWFGNSNNNNTNLQIGWDFNFNPNNTDAWWNLSNWANNRSNVLKQFYNVGARVFTYNGTLAVNDILKGDFCEFNQYLQKEYVVSKMSHKFSFNPNHFSNSSSSNLPNGYSYIPHHMVKIKEYSSYVEKGNREDVANIPDYAFFSEYENKWRWRDLFEYGYVDADGIGVDYPFLNGAHYPFSQIIFLQRPMKKQSVINYNEVSYPPVIDDCE